MNWVVIHLNGGVIYYRHLKPTGRVLIMDHQKELIHQGILDAVILRGRAGVVALTIGVAVCLSYFVLSLPVFGIVFVMGCFLAIEPHLYLLEKREFYRSLSAEDRRFYLNGFGYVITNGNLKYYLTVGLSLLVFLLMTGRV